MKCFLKVILSILLAVLVITVPKNLYMELNTDKITDEMYKRREKYFYGVINVWQIDSFEGGTGSRTNFLKEISKKFEKQNNGVFINIESITAEKAEKLILSGQKRPDMISYGASVKIDDSLFSKLRLQNQINLLNDAIKEKAVPWCMGAYFMIGDSDKTKWGNDGFIKETKKGSYTVFSVGVPERRGHNGLMGIVLNVKDDYGILKGTSQEIFDAYNYSGKVNRMIGTQRDLYRLQSLEKRELAKQGDVTFLGYTDLFQYISIFNCNNEKKIVTMNKYIDFLVEKTQQDCLGEIGMFPVIKEAQPQYNNSFMEMAWQKMQTDGINEKIQKDG